MNNKITTESKGKDYAEIGEEIVLEDTPETLMVYKGYMSSKGFGGDIIRYKKEKDGSLKDLTKVNFKTLHEYDSIKITLHSDAAKKLYESFKITEELARQRGNSYGVRQFQISNSNSIVIDDSNKAIAIKELLKLNCGLEIWEELSKNSSDLARKLALSKIQKDRIDALKKFKELLNDGRVTEDDWQIFFENNTWIFGYGLRYQFLKTIQSQPNYGGASLSGKGNQRGDFLTVSEASVKYTCLVEIKKPSTKLLRSPDYRNGACAISDELAGAISQIQANCSQWEFNSRTMENQELLKNIYTVSPKGIIIIGNTEQLIDLSKRGSFERFRREMHNPEIITYDELYERAKFICLNG